MSDDALRQDVKKLKTLLAYANPYATDRPVRDPVGIPSTFYPPVTPNAQAVADRFPELAVLVQRDTAVLPDAANREGYAPDDHLYYWLMGLDDFATVTAVVHAHGTAGGRYFDFGGSTGRLFRHFAFQSDEWDVWSSDFNVNSVEWNIRYMPSRVKAFLNSYYPSLPIEDNFFDLVTAFSVFTHLDETEIPWLLELRRITKVGGFLALTTAGQKCWRLHLNSERRKQIENFRPDLLTYSTLPDGKHVVTWRDDNPYRHMTYMTEGHVRTVWGRFFEIVAFMPAAHQGSQDLVFLRKQ